MMLLNPSEIEGEQFDAASARSSIARRLGVDIGALAPVDRHVEGVVEAVLDVTAHCDAPITRERIVGWHAALFPTGYSGRTRIRGGSWRDNTAGLQVVSGPTGRQLVLFEAPPVTRLEVEMRRFIEWINDDTEDASFLKAGLGDLWFVTLHPFGDGNGRVARAVGLCPPGQSRWKSPMVLQFVRPNTTGAESLL